MEEITLQVRQDEESGWLVAWWDDPGGAGGITTQGQDLRDPPHAASETATIGHAERPTEFDLLNVPADQFAVLQG